MNEPKYVYIMYPVELDKIKDIPLPIKENSIITVNDEEDFVPLWYGNAAFPEDEI